MALTDNFKDILKVVQTVNNLDLHKKLSELQNAVYSLEEETRTLREQLREREDHAEMPPAFTRKITPTI